MPDGRDKRMTALCRTNGRCRDPSVLEGPFPGSGTTGLSRLAGLRMPLFRSGTALGGFHSDPLAL